MMSSAQENRSTTSTYSPVDPINPSAQLPRLPNIAVMDRDAKQAALAQWVAWFNGNRNVVDSTLEHQLDRALVAFDRQQVTPGQFSELQESFDNWVRKLPDGI